MTYLTSTKWAWWNHVCTHFFGIVVSNQGVVDHVLAIHNEIGFFKLITGILLERTHNAHTMSVVRIFDPNGSLGIWRPKFGSHHHKNVKTLIIIVFASIFFKIGDASHNRIRWHFSFFKKFLVTFFVDVGHFQSKTKLQAEHWAGIYTAWLLLLRKLRARACAPSSTADCMSVGFGRRKKRRKKRKWLKYVAFKNRYKFLRG